ncbi:MAG TPA: sulfatase-like hydrolase/transferase [Candidatus Polarisedimenticolia bacterium]
MEHERIAFPSFPYEWPPASLILVHWPVPHLPHPVGLHNGSTSERNGDYREEYFANLALSDRTLGELRRAMERAGLWERTVVLITSDHALRNEIWGDRARGAAMTAGGRPLPLVPFLLKLPGQDRPLEYSGSFNTVLSHELILALLRGELSSPESALRWLDQNRARFPIS